ncbi:MAG: TOBE domain-containing protein, partial [Methyloceanibacter sp.]
ILAARTFSDLNELPARVEQGSAETALGRFPADGVGEGEAIVCVRQGGVMLLPRGQGIPARVLDVRFLGDVALVEMAVQGLDEPLLSRVRESDAPSLGTEIGVAIDPSAVLVFEAENGTAPDAA